jgi:hypothetical protein
MSAAKTRFPAYMKGGEKVYAAKITSIEPFARHWLPPELSGSMRVTFGDIDRHANIVPSWLNQHNPQVGGFFVVRDGPNGTVAEYVAPEQFAQSYKGEAT